MTTIDKKTISIIGAESSGKSTLAIYLKGYFDAVLVNEQSREYLQKIKLDYTENDIQQIAQIQHQAELDAISDGSKLVILDTELITIKIWLEFYGFHCPKWIINAISNSRIDMYLLLYPDLPWISDGLRNNENDRYKIFNLFETELKNFNKNYRIIKGSNRENQAISILNTLNIS